MPSFRDKTYAAFLFDMDGTMLDSTLVVEKVWETWAARHGVDMATLLPVLHGVQARDTMRRFGGEGLDLEAELSWYHAAEMADVEGIVPIAGIHDLVAGLKPHEWAVVTSANRELAELRLATVGLPLPETLITAYDVERGKPDPQGFLLGAQKLGVPIGECLVFEDSPAGVAAARAAGAHVAIVGDLVAPAPGDLAIADYL